MEAGLNGVHTCPLESGEQSCSLLVPWEACLLWGLSLSALFPVWTGTSAHLPHALEVLAGPESRLLCLQTSPSYSSISGFLLCWELGEKTDCLQHRQQWFGKGA